jgi:hypothetical protein
VLAALTTLVALVALEGAARLLPVELSGRREIVEDPGGRGEAMVANEEVPGWDLRQPEGHVGPMHYTANHWRMRGPEYPEEKPANAVRVIFVGDSSIFGFRLEWEETMSAQLERLREARFPGRDYQVANCAAPGHSTVQSLYKLERHCLAFQPDVVVLGNGNSDATFWDQADRDRFHLPAYSSAGQWLQASALYRTLRNSWLEWALVLRGPREIPQLDKPRDPSSSVRRVPPEEYRENLHRLVELSRSAGAEPVLLVLPSLGLMRGGAPPGGESPYRGIMREVAAASGTRLADGDARFRALPAETDGLFLDPVHPGPEGADLLAVLLDEVLGAAPP